MNCMTHPDTPAVTTCAQCATGMCRECVDNGIRSSDKTTSICPSCAPDVLRGGILELKSQRMKNKFKLYLSSGIVALGFCFAIWGFYDGLTRMNYGVGAAAGQGMLPILLALGLVGALSIAKRRITTPATTDDILFELRTIKYTDSDTAAIFGLFGLMFSVAFAFVAGVVVGPLNMYRYHTSIKSGSEQIQRYEEMLARYTAPAPALPESAGQSGAA